MPDFKDFLNIMTKYCNDPSPIFKTNDLFSAKIAYTKAFQDGIFKYIDNSVKNIDIKNVFLFYKEAKGERLSIWDVDQQIKGLANKLQSNGDTEIYNEFINNYYDSRNSNAETKIEYLDSFLKKYKDNEIVKKETKIISNILSVSIRKEISKLDKDNILKFLKTTSESLEKDGYNLDELAPNEKDYICYLDNLSNDKPKYEEKINSIISTLNEETDKEFIDTLKTLNNILVIPNSFINDQSKVAELGGIENDSKKQDYIYESIKKENSEIVDHVSKTKRLIQVNVNDTDKIPTIIKNITSKETKISKKDQDTILSIFDKMDRYGISPTDKVSSEQTIKMYSFTNLINIRKEIEKEFNKNTIDKEKIINLTKSYKDLESKYDELLEDVNNLGELNFFVSNVSSSRVDEVPEKYRVNITTSSKLNALWIAKGYFNNVEIDAKEFLNNPIEYVKIANLKVFSDDTPLANYFKKYKNNRIELLEQLNIIAEYNELSTAINSTLAIPFSTERATSGILSMINDPKIRLELEKNMMLYIDGVAGRIGGVLSNFITNGLGFDNEKIQNIVNLLVAPDEDFNLLNFCVQTKDLINPITNNFFEPYNTLKAIEKTGANESINRLIELGSSNLFEGDEIQRINKLLADKIIESKVELTKNEKEIVKSWSNNKPIRNVNLTTFNAEKAIKSIEKNGINKENIEDIVRSYAEIKYSYSSRNIFARIFYSECRKQNELIKSIKNSLIKEEINMNAVNEYCTDHNEYKDEKDSLDKVKASVGPIDIHYFQERKPTIINEEVIVTETSKQVDLNLNNTIEIEIDDLNRTL